MERPSFKRVGLVALQHAPVLRAQVQGVALVVHGLDPSEQLAIEQMASEWAANAGAYSASISWMAGLVWLDVSR